MPDRWLWDRSGEPDPEVQKLEGLLGRLRHEAQPLELPEKARAPGRAPRRPRIAFPWAPRWAFAAAAALLVTYAIFALTRPAGWEVARLSGSPRVAASPIAGTGRLAEGEWLETDAASRARVRVGRIGLVEIEPNTRVRLVGAGRGQHRLALARGILHALILAPPRQFVVETPSAVAVDLGCAYTLEVDERGGGMLSVIAGWVSFEHRGRESFIPAGARCATRPGLGPGTPYFADASAELKNALVALDLAAQRPAPEALGQVLVAARPADGLTLWHLLARLDERDRGRVHDRMAALLAPPPGVSRDAVVRGERQALDRWWAALGLGDAKDWRRWKGKWPGAARKPVEPS
jgi:FecR-like protein